MLNLMLELHNRIYQLPVFVFFFVLFSESTFYAHNDTHICKGRHMGTVTCICCCLRSAIAPVLSYPSLHYCLAQCQAFLSPVAASDWPIDSGSNSLFQTLQMASTRDGRLKRRSLLFPNLCQSLLILKVIPPKK
jgi:hypothetical protein